MDYRIIAMKLEGEYEKVFEEVEAYTIVKNYAGEGNDELMMDLLDMLLTAQEEGKEPEKIIGSDVKKFCEEYFSVYDIKADRIDRSIRMLVWWAWLGVIYCVLDLFDEKMKFVGWTPGMKTDWTVMVCCIGAAFLVSIVLEWILLAVYHYKNLQFNKLLSGIIVIVSILSAVLGIVIAEKCNVQVLLPYEFALIGSIVVILFGSVYKRMKNYAKYGSFRKPKEKEERVKLLYFDDAVDGVSTPYEKELIQSFSELYDKKNAKRQKKNQPAMTAEEFMEFLEKENAKMKRDSKLIPMIWGMICIVTTAVMALAGGFRNVLDACIFFAILAGAMMVIYYLIFGKFIYGKILSDRIRLLAKCRKHDKTILDYRELP